jgi:PEP-CTERM motif
VKAPFIFLSSIILAAATANATPALVTGTPGNSLLATPTGPSPSFGTLINFDSLTPNSTLTAGQFAAQGVTSISSPDGLLVIPFSSQSSPNEIFDNSADGSANITISLASGANEIGIGIADSDTVSITLQALNSSGVGFGNLFTITVPENTPTAGNAYFAISDTSNDIFGLQVVQSTGSVSNSGLAIDDLQFASATSTAAPEPASLALFGAGALLIGLTARRRKNS